MGGRGSAGKRHLLGEGYDINSKDAKLDNELMIAGMNRDIANGVETQKTLDFIEKQYKKGMKKEQLQILDQYGFVVKAYQGDATSVAYDARYVKGRVVTHNHPGRWGGTFSKADVDGMIWGAKEKRASAAEGVYSIKATKNANPQGLSMALKQAVPGIRTRMGKISQRISGWHIENPQRRATINRRLQLAALHRWYQKNAEKYGYEYSFVKNKGYKI